MKKQNKYDVPLRDPNEKKEYYSKRIKMLYKKPPFYYFLPMAGYIIYMKDSIEAAEEAGLLDSSTPGGKIMDDFTKKYMLSLNVFFPIWNFLSMLLFNFTFFIWSSKAKKAIKANENALLYKDFGSFNL